MSLKAAITVNRPREEVQRLFESDELRPGFLGGGGGAVRFADAPGDRGTEIHVVLERGGLGGLAEKVTGAAPLAKVKDELRHFKQRVETGVVVRSDAVPEGERVERKLKQRSAQPLDAAELEKAGLR